MTPEELVFNSITVSPRGAYISDPSQYYAGIALLERNRQWNIAKAYMQNPLLPNILNAIGAAWNALPFNTTAETVNPYMQYGEAPNTGGPIKPLSTFEKLSKAAKISNAKSLIVRKTKAAVRRDAEKLAAQELWERFGNNRARVIDPYKNYVYNEAERSAAIDFLKENPGMVGNIDTKVIDKYGGGNGPWDSFQYYYSPRLNRLMPNRKTLREVRKDNNELLKTIR